MYRVIIVDDEPVIVRGLSRTVDWKKWNCEVVGTAESGQEGMRLIAEKNPDILFSDISMPGLDGLSMIAAMKSEYAGMQITILTGFRDFDYAQQAIRLGVARFLLKPSKMEEIEEAIREMTGRLDEERALHSGEVRQKEEAKEREAEAPEDPEEDHAGNFIVRNALLYIEQNCTEKLKLADVAEKTYVSQWHLSKLLNHYTGKSFSDLLNHVRIEKAKRLLGDPSLRIGDVAEQVGFLDVAHFSRVFKKQEGISANAFRNRMK